MCVCVCVCDFERLLLIGNTKRTKITRTTLLLYLCHRLTRHERQATGRNQQSAQDIAGKSFNVKDNYGVFLNGALAYRDDGSLLFERTVSSELAKQLLHFVQDNESMSINLCSYDKFYAMSLDRKYDLHLHEKYDDPKPCSIGFEQTVPFASHDTRLG